MESDISDILPYNFAENEQKWNSEFSRRGLYSKQTVLNSSLPKYYVLEMFPYPSGKIHMGHVRNYTFGDIIARYKRLRGFNVLHPIGWDSFGLPAENAALDRKVHPKDWTLKNIEYMKSELKKLGFSYNWDLEVSTCSPDYYIYQQKIFAKLYKAGYVYRKCAMVNWDPVDNCVLANEQVIDGRGWRSGAVVEKRKLNQWFLKITDFADDLLKELPHLNGWPEKVRTMQENWIGKSTGLVINFETNTGTKFDVFSTRADTIFGATYISIAADHPIAQEAAKNNTKIADFIAECSKGSVNAEFIDKLEKKGIDTGLTALNPANGDKLPIYVANFVLSDYGCGAIFCTPAHDHRDYDFAKKYNLPIVKVVKCDNGALPYSESGIMINSGELNGLTTEQAREKISDILEKKGVAYRKTTVRLRDWGLSRQRYWGCPIPIIKCPKCGDVLVEEPVYLPDDVTFDQLGNPLDHHPTWKRVKCPKCGTEAERDTDTMDTFVDSSWYYMRYVQKLFGDKDLSNDLDLWLPVDQYVGGIEHAVLHLLYARFFTKVIAKEYGCEAQEPFKNLLTQGMVGHVTYRKSDGTWLYPEEVEFDKDGHCFESNTRDPVTVGRSEKMSKSKKNVVDPDKIIKSYGADSVRLFVVSDTPPEKDFDWTTSGLDGCWRFVNRTWRLYAYCADRKVKLSSLDISSESDITCAFHRAIKDITEALETNSFNKAVAYIRDIVNKLYNELDNVNNENFGAMLGNLAIMLSPFTPCLAESLWQLIGGNDLACLQKWPKYSDKLINCNTLIIPVQVNGKLRGNLEICADDDENTILERAINNEKVKVFIGDRKIIKKIYVKGKIVNLVI